VQHREEAVEDGKLKRTFDSMLERPQIRWDLDSLTIDRNGEEIELTDPLQIHEAVTQHQAKVFAASDSLLKQQGLEKPGLGSLEQWEEVLAHPDRLRTLLLEHLPKGHDENHFHVIISSFARPPTANAIEHDLQDLVPSYAEFTEAIRRAPRNSSPGPSGFSYSLLKLLSDPVARYLYDLMLTLWSTQTIPEFWKHKFLVMLSKTQETTATLGNLRPLGLIEITRKLWTNLVLNRVKQAVYKHRILQQTQNGFTPQKGTDSELLQLLSALESALSHEEGIDLMTWDIRKAFDSVGQNLQYLSWRRIGVPPWIASWLVRLDVGGSFTVRSPYALNQLLQAPTDQLASSTAGSLLLRSLGFTAEQGLTQGDVKSSSRMRFSRLSASRVAKASSVSPTSA
jgi:hypothetical protein